MRNITVAICCGLLVSGCSSFTERHQASGSFEYLAQQQHEALLIPAGYSSIKLNHQYDIPQVGSTANSALVGSKLDIRAPSLPMAVAPNSLVAERSQRTEIIFESFKDVETFRADLWQKINGFITDKTYGISMSRQGSSLTTRNIESDPIFMQTFGLEDQSLTQQYQFNLNIESQGHRASVNVELVKHQQQGVNIELNEFAQRRYETRMLNLFLAHLHQQTQQTKEINTELATKGMVLALGFDAQQDTAFVINAPFEQAWEKLARVLPRLGFVVDDRDKTLGTYFVRFEQQEISYLALLFKRQQAIPVILPEDKYQIKLQESGVNSILTIIDKAGDKLSTQRMTEISNQFKASFAKKNL
jgi:outer membrane protein assembly factor BamC